MKALSVTKCSLCGKEGFQATQSFDAVPSCEWEAVESVQQAREWGRLLAEALFPETMPKRSKRKLDYTPDLFADTESPYEKLKRENRVEDIVSRLTDMRGNGKILKGRCPFHSDRTPSFVVWPPTQRWRCFGACATGGDLIDLLKKTGDL